MKLLFDLFPVILFFATFKYSEKNPELASSWMGSLLGFVPDDIKLAPILLATVVVIAATVAQIIWVHSSRQGRQDALGQPGAGRRLWWPDAGLPERSIHQVEADHSLLGFRWQHGVQRPDPQENPIKAMLGEQLTLPEAIWGKLNLAWIAFFLIMGVLNLVIAFNFSTDTWVNFKLFGGMGLMLVFVLGQGMLLSKYVEEEK
jgi:intracellular septation protein